jgi:Bacterial protein of unknown function (DUF885)
VRSRALLLLTLLNWTVAPACSRDPTGEAGAPPDADQMFQEVADRFVADYLERDPVQATDLGVHDYDDRLADPTRAGVEAEVAALRRFRAEFGAIDPAGLSLSNQLDREQALTAIDATILDRTVVRPWATNPDVYSSGITEAAFVMIKRNFAPPEVRLKALIAREHAMVTTLEVARRNLDNPPAIYTDIAIEQLDGNKAFFQSSVPEAFTDVTDRSLLAEFRAANQGVVDALGAYKTFLEHDLRPRSKGTFVLGTQTLAAKFKADEMVDLPLGRLTDIARADLARNQEAFRKTAALIVPGLPPRTVLDRLTAQHPAPDTLIPVTQAGLDGLRRFITERHVVTIPSTNPATVEETPPFMRALTIASMDTPGPFETKASEAYYNVTLPDSSWPPAKVESYLRAWYPAQIANVSVHEVYPGHYTQFLYGPQFPSKIRKIFGAATNVEGWAHYCEQMMLDEGSAGNDPAYRLAQLQDALLRDVRFIVGIELHTGRITVDQAQKMFEEQGFQEPPVALAEARRGASDPTYGYYTLGKLMILKLRDDYRAKKGDAFSLQEFHDSFLKLGPLPLPLIRQAMLGEVGELLPQS